MKRMSPHQKDDSSMPKSYRMFSAFFSTTAEKKQSFHYLPSLQIVYLKRQMMSVH